MLYLPMHELTSAGRELRNLQPKLWRSVPRQRYLRRQQLQHLRLHQDQPAFRKSTKEYKPK